MFGVGLDACGVQSAPSFSITDAVSSNSSSWGDWSSSPYSSFSFNAGDGSCTATWSCAQCTLTAAASTSIVVTVKARAWIHYARYTLSTPAFSTGPQNIGTGEAFSVTDYITPTIASDQLTPENSFNQSAFGGGAGSTPTVVSVLLTPFSTSLNDVLQRISFEPSIANTRPGSLIKADTFAYSDAALAGVKFQFELSRNSFTISKYVVFSSRVLMSHTDTDIPVLYDIIRPHCAVKAGLQICST
jgi:hypothetical protein